MTPWPLSDISVFCVQFVLWLCLFVGFLFTPDSFGLHVFNMFRVEPIRSGSVRTSQGIERCFFLKVNKVVWMAERLVVLAVQRGVAEKRPDGRG